ncbi:LysR family transcriptional regulator [Ostreiculturibacter nitratireducens]|uniref:LysR family transcriptional regulator n=1 Tax=Ostreiculturibacter nitratireducens TaxID=3075226 RepID=UPI0031B5FC12
MDRLACDRMFVAVVETGSFAAAAQRLGTSSGQASKLVSRLESELGVRLLNRTTRAVATTEVGRAYFNEVRAILEEFDALDESVRDASRTPRGRVRLTAPLTFGILQLADALNDFAQSFPEITLDVSFSDRLANLVDEGFDAAIRVGRPADTSLIARKLCPSSILVVASEDYLARRGTPSVPADLAEHDCIIDTNFGTPEQWKFVFPEGPRSVTVTGRLRYSNAEACLRAAEAGLGIAHVPDFVAAPSLGAGRVRCLLGEYRDEPYGIYALYPPGRHLAAKVRVLVDFLAERFRNSGNWA